MIPKIIHYCWFGRGEKPKLVKKCIRSWKKYCPDYKIIEWNEDNYDIASAPLFVRQAFEAKMWAFVTDYIRLKVVYEHGGIYLDTDVQLIRRLNTVLNNKAYFGFEKIRNTYFVATGLGFGAEKGYPILAELMQPYEALPFYKENGKMNTIPCVYRDTALFVSHGLLVDGKEQLLDGGIHVYPVEFFAPFNYDSYTKTITKKTLSIHWYSMSWKTREEKINRHRRIKRKRLYPFLSIPIHITKRLIGQKKYEQLKKLFGFGNV